MGDVNRSVNIFLNEAEVSASMDKLEKKSAALQEKMEGAAGTAAWDKLNAEFTATEKKLETLGKQMKGELAPSMRQMEAAVTKLKNELRNTATNTEEFNQKAKKLKEAEASLNKIKQEAYGVNKALDETKKHAGVFGFMKDKLSDLGSSIPGLGTMIGALAGPFGLLAGVVAGVVGALSQSAIASDEFKFKLDGLKGAIRTLGDDMALFIKDKLKGFAEALDDPKKAAEGFASGLWDRFKTGWKGYGVVLEGFKNTSLKQVADGFVQVTTGSEQVVTRLTEYGKKLQESGKINEEFSRTMDELVVKKAEYEKQIAATQIQIEKETTIMKDATRSDEARLAAATAVIALEKKNTQAKIDSINAELTALHTLDKVRVMSSEEQAHILQLETQLLQAQATQESNIRKATNEKAQLELELRKQNTEQAYKQMGQAQIESINQTNDAIGDSFKKAEVKATNFKRSLGEIIKGTLENMRDSLTSFLDEWGEVFSAAFNSAKSIISGVVDFQNQKEEVALQKDKKRNDERKKALDKQLHGKKISQERYNKEIEKIEEEQRKREAEVKKKEWIRTRNARIATAAIDTAAGIVSAFATAGNIYAAIVMAALVAATGAVQIGLNAGQPMPEFARGGMLYGPSHDNGGMKVYRGHTPVAELEGGEYIVNKRATAQHLPLLERINASVPQFNTGGIFRTIQFANGGVIPNMSGASDPNTAMLSQILEQLRQPMRNYVVYEDVSDAGTSLQRAQSRASFSKS